MIEPTEVFRVFQEHRGDAIVIPTGTSGRFWADHTTNQKRDLVMGGAMGQTTSTALGLALSLPEEKVVLFDSEGALTMNMGILATIAGKKPKNFLHILMDNECYATTGGQPVPNADKIRYELIAEGSGYPATYAFDNLEDFTNNIEEILSKPGPVFVTMKVVPEVENVPIGARRRWRTRSQVQAVQDLQKELGIEVG